MHAYNNDGVLVFFNIGKAMGNLELNGFQNNSWSLENFSPVERGLGAYDPELHFLMKIYQTDGIILYSYLN